VYAKPTAAIERCASNPPTPSLDNTRLQETLRATWEMHETNAATKPSNSKQGEFQLAAAIPKAMGSKQRRVGAEGRESLPSRRQVRSTVTRGIPHFEVYVSEIPIRFSAMELVKLAMKRNVAGRKKSGRVEMVRAMRSNTNVNCGWMKIPKSRDPVKRYRVRSVGRSRAMEGLTSEVMAGRSFFLSSYFRKDVVV